ncbi:glutamate N-acetyltransferase/amino-acid N-acetyltransferase [Natronocella acetinitrilica]|uniref:Arginine biosynthesis bifunctional protein ArgJ n=1 Tax=Natronocella acetinitrilica TaxID=414046 RepID=A0AAE3G1H1_9GAMM|nr:bifunctional glutamate N-acetyltransferase/amino-acid acetyltransferase ArgJ [Natronocella acetinitrilica]MCP1673845.1 glutamate N-acetyltransferase/amino-acid N-acetyltransferase [Natronocella acetinitrilica]
MPVGLGPLPELLPIKGVRLGVACAAIKKPDHPDLTLMELAAGTRVAAVFTRNRFRAAPVQIALRHLTAAAPRWLLINTGNANAGTGARGLADAERCCGGVAELADMPIESVLPFSTGVIGEPLAVDRLVGALPQAMDALRPDGWAQAAGAILTTDTLPKASSREVTLSGGRIRLTGMAKGAGMIRPDMATMLAFLATDAGLEQELLDGALRKAVRYSFNRITVDGDTSTNDACVLAATGGSGVRVDSDDDRRLFQEALDSLCRELAQAVVRDGEGVTRFITIEVRGGGSERESEAVAYTIAHSPLVKTAAFAGDPNWGRILAAIGRSGIDDLDVGRVCIWLDDYLIAENGGRAADYLESEAARRMAREQVTIGVDLGRGEAAATVWTTDFSYEYVRINAEYRT